MKTNPDQTLCDFAEGVWRKYLVSREESILVEYDEHMVHCDECFVELKGWERRQQVERV